MSPELAAVNDGRGVYRLKSVGTTEALGSESIDKLAALLGALSARREGLSLGGDPHNAHYIPKLEQDIGVVSAEMARRQPDTNAT